MKSLFKTLVVVAGVAASATAMAEEWTPPGPIKAMIAFRAGGGTDTLTRLLIEELEARKGWKLIPENVAGKGGLNMANELKGQATDGTVIGIAVTETFGYNMATTPKARLTPADYTGLTTIAGFQMGLAALPSKGWSSFEDMAAAAKDGENVRFGAMSPRVADLAYLLGKAHGFEFNIVSVRGGKAVLDGLNAGDLDVGLITGAHSKGVTRGELVNLAAAEPERLAISPDAPTFAELGIDFDASGEFVVVAPAGIDPAARDALTAAMVEIIQDPNTKAGSFVAGNLGGAVIYTGADLDARLQQGFDDANALLDAVSE